jgi:hypothetical protein
VKWPWTKRERESEPTFDDPGKIDGFVNDADTVQAWRDYATEHGIKLTDWGENARAGAGWVYTYRVEGVAGFGMDSELYEALVEVDLAAVRLSRSPALLMHQSAAPSIEWIARRVREQLAAADAGLDH